jgi:quinolinate synthase
MKKNNLENIYRALLEETPELILSQEIMDKARIPIEKMLSLSIGL